MLKITDSRHEDHARDLLADSQAVITSDRWWAYNHLPLARRQVCWSHLQRDLQAQYEAGGAEHELGRVGLEICDELFFSWEAFQHTGDRRQLRRVIRQLQRRLKPILRIYSGKKPRYKTSTVKAGCNFFKCSAALKPTRPLPIIITSALSINAVRSQYENVFTLKFLLF